MFINCDVWNGSKKINKTFDTDLYEWYDFIKKLDKVSVPHKAPYQPPLITDYSVLLKILKNMSNTTVFI